MSTAASPQSSIRAGIGCILVGIFSLTLSDGLAKWLGAFYSPIQLLFLRALIALPLITTVVLCLGGHRALRTRHIGVHLLRGALNVVSAACFYLGLTMLPLAETTAIAFCAPLFVTAISVVFLGEKVSTGGWLAIFAGFAGFHGNGRSIGDPAVTRVGQFDRQPGTYGKIDAAHHNIVLPVPYVVAIGIKKQVAVAVADTGAIAPHVGHTLRLLRTTR